MFILGSNLSEHPQRRPSYASPRVGHRARAAHGGRSAAKLGIQEFPKGIEAQRRAIHPGTAKRRVFQRKTAPPKSRRSGDAEGDGHLKSGVIMEVDGMAPWMTMFRRPSRWW